MACQILIVGAGGIGAFYASRLAVADDTDVSVLCRSNYDVVKASGFQVKSSTFGDYIFLPKSTFRSREEASQAASWDYIVVCTKALPDLDDGSEALEGLVSDSTSIVLIQNGLGVEVPYSKRFPNTPILSAVTITSTAQSEPGVIQHYGRTGTSLGPYLPHTAPGVPRSPFDTRARDDREAVKINRRFVKLLKAGGIRDAAEHDHAQLQSIRWHKVAINGAMSSASVLSGGLSTRQMANDKEVRAHLKAVMNEVLAVAPKVLGIALPDDLATPDAILHGVSTGRTESKPSMRLDWEAGRKMELEVILGNPIRAARAKGLQMPRLESSYALLRAAQDNRDSRNSHKL